AGGRRQTAGIGQRPCPGVLERTGLPGGNPTGLARPDCGPCATCDDNGEERSSWRLRPEAVPRLKLMASEELSRGHAAFPRGLQFGDLDRPVCASNHPKPILVSSR